MKRCPQCEFLYEDDQSLCDMDGVLLVYDSRTFPNLHALATVPPLPGKSVRRHRMVPAFATILLTAVIASFYYFSNPRSVAPPNNFAPASVTVPPAPTPEVNQAQPPVIEPTEKVETQPPPTTKVAAPPAKKATTKPAAVKSPEAKKEGSKVGSILKKTGKILKKPFKF
ncbi:MAG TPA: hypothetical protein VHH35_05180 [Pyrinomonadaceae bacterium]|nr:hypothetical protein [Pyrinomonadaceae bacterium]